MTADDMRKSQQEAQRRLFRTTYAQAFLDHGPEAKPAAPKDDALAAAAGKLKKAETVVKTASLAEQVASEKATS